MSEKDGQAILLGILIGLYIGAFIFTFWGTMMSVGMVQAFGISLLAGAAALHYLYQNLFSLN